MTSSTSTTINSDSFTITEDQKRVIGKIIQVNLTKILCLQVNLTCFDASTCNEVIESFIDGFANKLAQQISEHDQNKHNKSRKKTKAVAQSSQGSSHLDLPTENTKKFVLETNHQIHQSCLSLKKTERNTLLANLDQYLKHAIASQIRLLDVINIYQNYIHHQIIDNDMQVDMASYLHTEDLSIPENPNLPAIHDSFTASLIQFKRDLDKFKPEHLETSVEHNAKLINAFGIVSFGVLILFAMFGVDTIKDTVNNYRQWMYYAAYASLSFYIVHRVATMIFTPSIVRVINQKRAEEKEAVSQELAVKHKTNVRQLTKLEFFKIYIDNNKQTLPLYLDNFKKFEKTLPDPADEEEQPFIGSTNLLQDPNNATEERPVNPSVAENSFTSESNKDPQNKKKQRQPNNKSTIQQRDVLTTITTTNGITLPANAIHYFSNGKYQNQCFYINKTSIKKELGERYVEYMQRLWKELTKYEKEDKEFKSNKSLGKPGIKTSKPKDATLYPSPTLGTYAPMTMKVKGGNGERLGGFTTFFTKQQQTPKPDGSSTTSTKEYALTILDYHMAANRAPGH